MKLHNVNVLYETNENKEEKEKMTLDQKLMELKKIVSIMQKDSEGHGYNYVSEESILLALNAKMIELACKFKKKGTDNEYFLAWTTTPWTLASNIALTV